MEDFGSLFLLDDDDDDCGILDLRENTKTSEKDKWIKIQLQWFLLFSNLWAKRLITQSTNI